MKGQQLWIQWPGYILTYYTTFPHIEQAAWGQGLTFCFAISPCVPLELWPAKDLSCWAHTGLALRAEPCGQWTLGQCGWWPLVTAPPWGFCFPFLCLYSKPLPSPSENHSDVLMAESTPSWVNDKQDAARKAGIRVTQIGLCPLASVYKLCHPSLHCRFPGESGLLCHQQIGCQYSIVPSLSFCQMRECGNNDLKYWSVLA